MNVVYLLGNGFDLNLGLKTQYKDFYDSYTSKNSTQASVNQFKSDISSDFNKWCDLELSLGEYTTTIDSLSCLDDIHADLVDELAEYLFSVQEKFESNVASKISKNYFLSDLFQPEAYLKNRDAQALNQYKSTLGSSSVNYSIITFNYTQTVEAILGIKTRENQLNVSNESLKLGNISHRLLNILHVHGSLEEDMVLGVDSESQILNQSLAKDDDALKQLVKSKCNLAMRHGVEVECEKLINQASFICIFGSSIGKTDQIWWDLIAKKLKTSNTKLIIFDYWPGMSKRRSQLQDRERKRILQRFFGNEDTADVESKVYFSFNSKIFSLLPKKSKEVI